MNTLVMGETQAQKYSEMENHALGILTEFFKGNREFGDDVKMAMQGLNIVGKNRQTLTARQGIRFSMVRAITDDAKILKKYVESTNPEMGKLLKG